MSWFKNNVFLILLILIQLLNAVSGKNWAKWYKSKNLVNLELRSGRSLGIFKEGPSGFEVLMEGLQYNINSSIFIDPVNHGTAQADLITGKGLILKGNLRDPITFTMDLPKLPKQTNICGLVVTSLEDKGSAFILDLQVLWQSNKKVPWDIIANPTNGEFKFNLGMKPGSNTRVIIFDSIPSLSFMLMLTTTPGKNVNLKLAFLHDCRYKNSIEIKDCSEKIDNNPRLSTLPFEVPLSVICPTDCIRTWPCWGFKVYSSDSPICWAATQNFGRNGDGRYTFYKIPKVLQYRMEVNPLFNHGIFCRQSIISYPGFTFDRKYLDYSRNEYRETMGA